MMSHLQNSLMRWSLALCALSLTRAPAFGQCEPLGWTPLGEGITDSDEIHAIATYDDGSGPALYVGGEFLEAGGVPVNRIAKWDGKTWSDLGGGVVGYVFALTVFDDGLGPQLYAGGDFISAGGVPVAGVARWNGTSWSAPPGLAPGGWVKTFAVSADRSLLYVGGVFSGPDVRVWDGTTMTPLGATGATGPSGAVNVLAFFDAGLGAGPELYVAGGFDTINGVAAKAIARWDSSQSTWQPVDGGITNSNGSTGDVHALAVCDDGTGPALFVGGNFTFAGAVNSRTCAKWTGQAWVNATTGGTLYDLLVYRTSAPQRLFAAGGIGGSGTFSPRLILEWRGGAWRGLSTIEGYPDTLGLFDRGPSEHLVAAGNLVSSAGGNPIGQIAQWNLADRDCNGNRQFDDCDIASGYSQDCDGNAVPDECETEHIYELDNDVTATTQTIGGGPAEWLWLNQFTVIPGSEVITHIAIPWNYRAATGLPVTLLIYDDPNNDGNPADAVLLRTAAAENFAIEWNPPLHFAKIPVKPTNVGAAGDSFFIGAFAPVNDSQNPVPIASASGNLQRSWHKLDVPGAIDITDLSAGGAPTLFYRNWFIRALSLDCNGNSIWDECDIDSGVSFDLNKNGIPDECETAPCSADIAGDDGVVDVNDLLALIGAWGPCPAPCAADINGDGSVDVNDLLILVGAWGPC